MNSLRTGMWRMRFPRRERELSMVRLKGLAQGIMTTRSDEIGCLHFFGVMDHFAEMQFSGREAAAAMPPVQDHLNRCRDCREEYLVLLAVLGAKPVD